MNLQKFLVQLLQLWRKRLQLWNLLNNVFKMLPQEKSPSLSQESFCSTSQSAILCEELSKTQCLSSGTAMEKQYHYSETPFLQLLSKLLIHNLLQNNSAHTVNHKHDRSFPHSRHLQLLSNKLSILLETQCYKRRCWRLHGSGIINREDTNWKRSFRSGSLEILGEKRLGPTSTLGVTLHFIGYMREVIWIGEHSPRLKEAAF